MNDRNPVEFGGASVKRYEAILLLRPELDTADFDASTSPAESLDPAREDQTAPLQLLSETPEYFDQLFMLLGQQPGVVQDAWTILKMVPDHPETERKLRCLEETAVPDWPSLLHGHAPLRLLYNLQIMCKTTDLVADQYAPVKERERAVRWSLAFVRTGGISYLISVLASWDMVAQCATPLTKASLSALIRLIATFLVGSKGVLEGIRGGAAANGQEGGHDDMEVAGLAEEEPMEEEDGREDARGVLAVHKASAKVFADLDRKGLATKLLDVLNEVSLTHRTGETG